MFSGHYGIKLKIYRYLETKEHTPKYLISHRRNLKKNYEVF